ncbi:CRE-NHR-159 protein [Caenorhabditis remanei]|uniref:CRE-NHR-159 protein n=1 Tax=Caenorhabditis remanei TaxID=31234 RepID=E3NEK8_CAERE|nr:CRE-NHR-159 protein [Caenorhabditis remanei]
MLAKCSSVVSSPNTLTIIASIRTAVFLVAISLCLKIKKEITGYSEVSDSIPKCKSCRYQRCLDLGMNYAIREKKRLMQLQNRRDAEVAAIISGLLCQDSHRTQILTSCFTIMNPSLEEMVEKVNVKIHVKVPKESLRPQDWSFFALYTTVDFLLNLEFMKELQTSEKLILLRHSASKCSLFGGAMRTYREKKDRMTTVDGQDIYPDEMRKLLGYEKGTDEFLNRIRSFVVSKIVEMSVTAEECVLIGAIMFCNPGKFSTLFYEPDNSRARSIVAAQQQKYSDTLFQYCIHTYQQNGPTRFTDLLSLCPIIQRNFEDLQYLTMVFRLAMKGTSMQFRKIVEELI